MTDEKYDILKRYFGYDTFREGQEQVIDELISGRDVLGVMPTGAGKSLCYQIPALIFPGITLVISPLISLMKDQVRALNEAGVHAAYLNSSLTQGQYYKALSLAVGGKISDHLRGTGAASDRFVPFICGECRYRDGCCG